MATTERGDNFSDSVPKVASPVPKVARPTPERGDDFSDSAPSSIVPWGQIIEIEDITGEAKQMTYYDAVKNGLMPAGLTYNELGAAVNAANDLYIQNQMDALAPSGGSGRYGRSGGAAAPIYAKPDKDAVTEQVKSYVVATTGTIDEATIASATAAFLKADKVAFDKRETQGVDPWQAVLKVVRASAGYQDIHELRPESVDEMDWVVERQTKLRQLGLSASLAEDVGIEQARFGSSDEGLRGAGEVAQFQQTGRLLATQRERLKQSARAAIGLVR